VRRFLLIAMLAGAFAPSAAADGLPVLGIDDGSSGVTVPGALSRYVTIPTRGGTLVERINRNGGQVLAASLFPGNYTIPAVAYDATPGGLSADADTLTLIEPRTGFPRASTKLLVLDTPSLRHRATITLRGDFSFDAISPDGSHLFLIQYTSPNDPTSYAVRSYSVRSLRLDPALVVDPANPREKMRGNPLSRVASSDGRWAYTLYDGGGGTPFVHALDTASGTARCIDLSGLNLRTVWRLRLQGHSRSIDVVDRGKTLLAVDTRSFSVSRPHGSGHWVRYASLALAGAALVLLAVALGSARGWIGRRAAWRSALR
jgi:hypothetical protein